MKGQNMAQNDKNIVTEDKVTFRLCDDCLGVNLKTLIPKLKKKAPNAEFIIGCQSYCGPGRTQSFSLVFFIIDINSVYKFVSSRFSIINFSFDNKII